MKNNIRFKSLDFIRFLSLFSMILCHFSWVSKNKDTLLLMEHLGRLAIPGFLFSMGASLPIYLKKEKNKGKNNKNILISVFRKVVILVLLQIALDRLYYLSIFRDMLYVRYLLVYLSISLLFGYFTLYLNMLSRFIASLGFIFLTPLLYNKFIFIPLILGQGKEFALLSPWTGLLLIGTLIGELLTRDNDMNMNKYVKKSSLVFGMIFMVALVLFFTYEDNYQVSNFSATRLYVIAWISLLVLLFNILYWYQDVRKKLEILKEFVFLGSKPMVLYVMHIFFPVFMLYLHIPTTIEFIFIRSIIFLFIGWFLLRFTFLSRLRLY